MIREQFLSDITSTNLFSFKLVRDTAYLIEAALVQDRMGLLESDRILARVRIFLLDCIKFAHGLVKIERDSVYDTAYTAFADKRLAAAVMLDYDERLYAEIEALTLDTVVEVGKRGALFELQIRLSRELTAAAGRLYRLLERRQTHDSAVCGYPAYVLKGFSQLIAAVIGSAESNAAETHKPVRFLPDTVPRLLDYIGHSFDRFEHTEERKSYEALCSHSEQARFALRFYESASKSAAHLPLLADLAYRAALMQEQSF